MSKCNKCIHRKVCIDGANYKNAESCKYYIAEDDNETTIYVKMRKQGCFPNAEQAGNGLKHIIDKLSKGGEDNAN